MLNPYALESILQGTLKELPAQKIFGNFSRPTFFLWAVDNFVTDLRTNMCTKCGTILNTICRRRGLSE
jgi:hypothetical protein